MPVPALLSLAVVTLLSGLGAGAALLPASLTGPGSAAEQPEAVVAALAPGAGGGAPGVRAPSVPYASPSVSPSPSVTPSAKRKATAAPSTSATKKPAPKRSTITAPSQTAAPTAGSGRTAQENEVIRLTNVERDRAGCGPVELDTDLRAAMRLHVEELGTHGDLYISHISDDGRSFADRARAQGYDAAGGENVARGQRDAADVMTSWMNSDGHRANIVNCSFTAIGVGMAKGVDGTLVWGQIFGRS